MGKLQLDILSIENFGWVSEHQNLFVRITCNPYVLYSKRISKVKRAHPLGSVDVDPGDDLTMGSYSGSQGLKHSFNQKIILPIHNYFHSITIEIVNQLSKGWFREYQQEYVIERFDIRIPDIHLLHHEVPSSKDHVFKLPINDRRDFKKFGMKTVSKNEEDLQGKEQAYLNIRLVDLTRVETMLKKNPNRDIIEDRK